MEQFTNLINESNKIIEKRLKKRLEEIQTPEGLQKSLQRNGKNYKLNPEKKLKNWLKKQAKKEQIEIENNIHEVENAPDFKDDFIITIEWKPSPTWGKNPKSYGSNGFEGHSIGGCGYDKQSTATAQALNSNKSILKLLYKEKNDNLETDNRTLLGYGSGYGIIPSFEGGVGVNSHRAILEKIGLKMQTITNTKNTDVFLITIADKKKEKPDQTKE